VSGKRRSRPTIRKRLPAVRVFERGQEVPVDMSRRSTPARLEEARRAGFRNRRVGSGVPEERADSLMAAWTADAALRGVRDSDNGFWQSCWEWTWARRRS
jgi:hypothetical protein